MVFTLVGVVLLSLAGTFGAVLVAAALVGWARRCFIRRRRVSRGWRRAGGTVLRSRSSKSAATPGARSARCSPRSCSRTVRRRASPGSSCCRCLAIALLLRVGRWYRAQLAAHHASGAARRAPASSGVSRARIVVTITILALLIFSKYFYLASLSSYYTFFLIHNSASRCATRSFIFSCFSLPSPRARSSAGPWVIASGENT